VGDNISVSELAVPEVLSDPVVHASADAEALVVGQNDKPVPHFDVACLCVWEVSDCCERYQLVTDPAAEALGGFVQVSA
jgi:hypothetical protein